MSGSQHADFDINCDPDNPRKAKYEDVLAASRRIAGTVVLTPCNRGNLSEKLGLELYYKQEFMQVTGCFKERGVRNTLMQLSDEQKKYGVISATTGNHGIAMCYHSRQLNIPCLIVMAKNANMNKMFKCQAMAAGNAKIYVHGESLHESKRHALATAREKKMLYVNGFDHLHVIEGQGTIGIEIMEQCPDVDAVLVPVGGGGLIAGIATAIKHIKPSTEVYGIQTEKTCCMAESFRKNEMVELPNIPPNIADGLSVNKVGPNSFYTLKGLLDKMIVVKDDWVMRALLYIVEHERFVVEGSSAVTVAAIMAGLLPNLKGKKVVAVLTGGNIDVKILSRAIERGLAAEGRFLKFTIALPDKPGAMAELCTLIGSIGASIRDISPQRGWVSGDVFSLETIVLCETRGWDHTKELIEIIKRNYTEYRFEDTCDKSGRSSQRAGPCLAPNPVCMQK